MGLDAAEFGRRVAEIAELARSLLPPDATEAALDYTALGSFETAQLVDRRTHRRDWGLHRSDLFTLLRALRRDCHAPGSGTWSTLRISLRATEWWAEADLADDEFRFRDEVTVADCARELAEFPRPDSRTPEWLADLAVLQLDADSFDPAQVSARPDSGWYFERAGRILADFLPEAPDLPLTDRLEDGRWSVLNPGRAWLAVRPAGGRCDRVVAFADARSALAHATAAVMVEHGVQVDSDLLRLARVVERRGSSEALAWGTCGTAATLTAELPRPSGDGRYIAIGPLGNRPYGHFVCEPGPPPEHGPFIGVRDVFEAALVAALPIGPAHRPERATAPVPRDEPPAPSPRQVLQPGTVVDAFEDNDQCFVFAVGTPDYRRGAWHRDKESVYHRYRVERPLPAAPGLLAPWGIDEDDLLRTDQGQGYYLGDVLVGDLVRDGWLTEITGPEEGPTLVRSARRGRRVTPPGPSPSDDARRAELLRAIERSLLDAAPEGWRRIDLGIRLLSEWSDTLVTVLMPDGACTEIEIPEDLLPRALELRSMMYRPDEGTWFSMRLMLDPPGDAWVGFDHDFAPAWPVDMPEEIWEHDLTVYPRAEEHVPRWLRHLLPDDWRPEGRPRLERRTAEGSW